ncbi:hypothetical protein ACLIA0_07520 [Bacillaceae bacterium W0354]
MSNNNKKEKEIKGSRSNGWFEFFGMILDVIIYMPRLLINFIKSFF